MFSPAKSEPEHADQRDAYEDHENCDGAFREMDNGSRHVRDLERGKAGRHTIVAPGRFPAIHIDDELRDYSCDIEQEWYEDCDANDARNPLFWFHIDLR